MNTIVLRPLNEILPTEATDPQRVQDTIAMILRSGLWTDPVCIERDSMALMDGHHRLAAARELGFAYIPTVSFTYDQVGVESSRDGEFVSPHEILRRAIEGELYPVKSTRHSFPVQSTSLIPLTVLRPKDGFDQRMAWVWDGEAAPHVQVPGARYRQPQAGRYRTAA
jgi:hypothetical protein